VKLLVDMNFSPRWVQTLSAAGFNATHWSAVGAATATDAAIMAYAVEHDYVVLTHDLDFGAILAATQGTKPSVVQVRSGNISPEVIGASLIAALRQMGPELEGGALLTLDPVRARLTLLPLPSNNP
jgi:predicted nuclease of predicted toxin-antitoxin system